MRTPRTDAILKSAWTVEEKLADMTSLARELEEKIRSANAIFAREELRDNRTCRHAMNPAFPEPNAEGSSAPTTEGSGA